MQIKLETGISLKIEGELGKYQTLPVDALIKISQTLQELVLSIAKHDINTSEGIDFNNFKLELTDFTKSSAVPRFEFTQRLLPTINDPNEQRKEVNKKVNKILSIITTGEYYKLRELYPNAAARNEIVEHVYEFTNSFKGSPVKIFGVREGKVTYKIRKFKSEVKNDLLGEIKNSHKEKSNEKAFATIKIIKTGNKSRTQIQEVFKIGSNSLSYSPKLINVNGKQYIFNSPLRCLFEKEEDYFVINNELIGVIGTGLTQDDAEKSFNEEFDYLFSRLNSLNDDKLGKKLLSSKTIINIIVKEVI